MSPKPTGHLQGNDLILTRSFRAPIDDVWTSVTDPESTARWFAHWEGEGGLGKTVRLQLVHEKGQPWSEATIESCEPPRHLALAMKDESGDWRVELSLTQTGDTTELRFVHHLTDRSLAGEIGPGWEYYLDMLVAARDGNPFPKFDDYYPAQKAYYVDEGGGE